MTIESSSDAGSSNTKSGLSQESSPGKPTKNPGVRIVGSRTYDPEKGTTCHQCRQKSLAISARCKKLKSRDKQCTLRFCHKCLINRYGEVAEEADGREDWVCPKCRGICNCSTCRPKKGFEPTGPLYHMAKKAGFFSVVEYLNHKESEGSGIETLGQIATGEQIKKEPQSSAAPGNNKEALNTGNKRRRVLKEPIQEEPCEIARPEEEIMLAQGIPLLTVAGVELSLEDVGPALQFLEFCNTFSEIFSMTNGLPESILREIASGRRGRREISSSAIQLHIQLLSLIRKDMGEGSISCSPSNKTSWFHALGNFVNESLCAPKELQLVFVDGAVEYDDLNSSQKLMLLNFLCDEILSTQDLRIWIEDGNIKFLEKKKEAKEKLCAAKRKKKKLKQKLKDDLARVTFPTTGEAPSSVSEHGHRIAEIKAESEKALAEVVESIGLLPERTERSDAVRTEPIMVEGNGRLYWRLRSFGTSTIMLQEIGNLDLHTPQEMWYTYNEENEQLLEKHISSLRSLRLRTCRGLKRKPSENPEEEKTDDSLNSSGSQKCSMEGGNGAGNSVNG